MGQLHSRGHLSIGPCLFACGVQAGGSLLVQAMPVTGVDRLYDKAPILD